MLPEPLHPIKAGNDADGSHGEGEDDKVGEEVERCGIDIEGSLLPRWRCTIKLHWKISTKRTARSRHCGIYLIYSGVYQTLQVEH
jgi:hypothetical protein